MSSSPPHPPSKDEIPSSPSRRVKRDVSYAESDDEEESVAVTGKTRKTSLKKRKVLIDDDDSDEYKDDGASDDDDDYQQEADDDDEVMSNNNFVDKTPPKTPSGTGKSSLSKFSSNSAYKAAKQQPQQTATPTRSNSSPKTGSVEYSEERYPWLVDIRDADGNPTDHPDYDPRTIYVPKSAWPRFTPFEKQYWEVKSKMWNTVVFFKKGKFYELYEPDADIAHNEFDLKLAGGGRANMRLAGIPEATFDYWASAFIARGHKVAKVDQKETALAKEMRDRTGGKKEEKVIKRELSCVLTGGTLTDETMLVDDMSTYCMAIKQNDQVFAICFIDTSTGEILVSEFEDDVDYSQLETLVAQTRPRELLLEKGGLEQRATRILKNNTSLETLWNYLKPNTEFWDAERAQIELKKAGYFTEDSSYPEVLAAMVKDKPLSVSAFGALLWYLQSLKLADSLVSLGNFKWYDSVQKGTSMVLDGQSLQNLEIFANTYNGGPEGTLFKLLNRCITPFGKRKLKDWMCHPLMESSKINARLEAVDYLNENRDVSEFIEKRLSTLPDLERMLSRVHAGLLKVKDFMKLIQSFNTIYSLAQGLKEFPKLGGILAQLLEALPHLEETLPYWTNAFDHKRASEEGIIVPEPGVEEDFDSSLKVTQELEKELEEKLKEYKRTFGKDITYRDVGKELYLIEIPNNKTKDVPQSWTQMGSSSKVRRYWSPEVRKLVRELEEARERHRAIAENVRAKLYARFDEAYSTHWIPTVKVIASIDCLISLAKTSSSLGEPSCRPELVDSKDGVLDFTELRHPCFGSTSTAEFIPNDVALGGQNHANIALLTGANAAGKSTVLRMTCVAVIMAQMGCYVPAQKARLSPFDRIMTRLGANDNIFAGKSTFFVELSETKRMLNEATSKSLLVLDELGRGGSSSDGFAIAEAVLHHIATHIGSVGFFATHYGSLASSFKTHPQVEPRRMAILVDDETRKVTFLYKLEDGVSPGSFGMHVASMCGIDKSIVDRAEEAAKNFEHTAKMRKLLEVDKNHELVPLSMQSDFAWIVKHENDKLSDHGLHNMLKIVERL